MKINKLSRFVMGLSVLALYFNFLVVFGIGLSIDDFSKAFIIMTRKQLLYLLLLIMSIIFTGYNVKNNDKNVKIITIVILIISLILGWRYIWNTLLIVLAVILVFIDIMKTRHSDIISIQEKVEEIA